VTRAVRHRDHAGRAVATIVVAATVVAAIPLAARPADAQRPAWVGAAGVAATSPLLRDGNGTDVHLGAQPFVALRATQARGERHRLAPMVAARLGAAPVRLRAPGAAWSGGAAWQADLAAGGDVRPAAWVRVRALVGVSWLRGPRDIDPFAGARGPRPTIEGGATLARPGARLGLDVAVQGYRLAPRGGSAGGVARLLVGVSRALGASDAP
jgi:hypothetical protein